MGIPESFQVLLPPHLAGERDDTPTYYLWVFDPHEDKVHLEHNEGRHPAHRIDHSDLAERVPHPERIHGYAYPIQGGYRITTWEHRPVEEPHVRKLVELALKGEHRKSVESSQVQERALR